MTLPASRMKRWTLAAAAVAAAAFVVWSVGELLVLGGWRPLETPAARIVLIVLLAAAAVALEFHRAHRARRENDRLLEMIAAGGDSASRAAHEVAQLRARFEEATGKLRQARFTGPDGEPRLVGELPWYMIIGAPGSGKTTALVNAGLHFPLPGSGGTPAVTGVGGTRNCDWWFTSEAVLLDTAGRYTTQDSDSAADAAAWHGFLDLLKTFRPARPINGALLTLSLADALQGTPEQRARYAAHVRARLQELRERLGVRFPVYLLVTKADLLAGFAEFFGDLDAPGRARVWGMSFRDDEAPDARARFEAGYRGLSRRLQAGMVERLADEPDLQRRAAIYRFPQEFAGAAPAIAEFLDAAFRGTPEATALRGVYFTSGTQEGSPIDRVLGTLARGFGLERAAAVAASGTGKSFFLTRLLREVVFRESGLAGFDPARARRDQVQRMLGYAAIAGITVLLAAAWMRSYFANDAWVARVDEEVRSARKAVPADLPATVELPAVIAGLDALARLPGAGDAPPDWGLSQQRKLVEQAERAYRTALREALMPRYAGALEAAMREALRSPGRNDGLGELLAAYEALGAAAPAAVSDALIERLWRLPAPGTARAGVHLRAAQAQGIALQRPRDESIIRDARQRLGASKG